MSNTWANLKPIIQQAILNNQTFAGIFELFIRRWITGLAIRLTRSTQSCKGRLNSFPLRPPIVMWGNLFLLHGDFWLQHHKNRNKLKTLKITEPYNNLKLLIKIIRRHDFLPWNSEVKDEKKKNIDLLLLSWLIRKKHDIRS